MSPISLFYRGSVPVNPSTIHDRASIARSVVAQLTATVPHGGTVMSERCEAHARNCYYRIFLIAAVRGVMAFLFHQIPADFVPKPPLNKPKVPSNRQNSSERWIGGRRIPTAAFHYHPNVIAS
jgi:hypothetical protein